MKNPFWCGIVCLVLVLVCGQAGGREKAEWGVDIFDASMSPNDDYLGFWAGPLTPSGRGPLVEHSRLFVLDFEANNLICCRDLVLYGGALAWRPQEPSRLYVVEDRFTETDDIEQIGGSLIGFEPAESPVPTFTRRFDRDDDLVGYALRELAWSPSGRILSAITAMPLTKLHLSFDGGKSFVSTKNVGHLMSQQWADDETLLVEQWVGGNDIQIAEIKIDFEGVKSTRTIVESKPKLRLVGGLDGEVVYRTEHAVHIGNRLLIQTQDRVGWAIVREYVAVMLVSDDDSRKVVIYDGQGKILDKRPIPGHAALLGLSKRRKCIYLVEHKPLRIRCVGFGDARSLSAVWTVPRVDLPVSVIDW